MWNPLTMQERDRRAQLRSERWSQQEIAVKLGRSASTIGRELKRNRAASAYLPAQAHETACRRRERPLTPKMDRPQTNDFVTSGLAEQWSPDQIAGRLKRAHPDDVRRRVCAATIDSWIERPGSLREHWNAVGVGGANVPAAA